MRLLTILLIFISFLQANSSFSQAEKFPNLLLRSGSFIPEKNITESSVAEFNRNMQRVNGKSFLVLQFENIPTPSQRNELSAAGIELLDYIPHNAYIISTTRDLDHSQLRRLNARAVFQLQPEQKMHPNLVKSIYPSWATRTSGMIDLWISFPQTLSYAEIESLLKQGSVNIISTDYKEYHVIGIQVRKDRIYEMAGYPFIDYVEPAPAPDHHLNKESRNDSRGNVLNASTGVGGFNLNGEGVVIGIGDDADPQLHADFRDRLINFGPAGFSYHGTHVHGTVGGNGAINQENRGYAAKSKLITQYFSGILKNAPTYVSDFGMVVTNNSYGDIEDDCSYAGTYALSSRILDLQSMSYPSLQHVFAGGNDGSNSCPPYPVGFSTILGGYQAAKNILTVGAASQNRDGSIASFSSRGPVKDGRTKPELTADGTQITSSVPGNIYGLSSGTSMAAPAVTGGTALIYERYRQLNGGANPKSGLVKALVVNGTTDKGNSGPDFTHGFGWMNLYRSVDMLNNNRYFISTVANGGMNSHALNIPANTAEVKVMLYWHDPAAAVFASQTLVNDLDLELVTPSAVTILPWRLDITPANVNNTATNSSADHINNIEQVTLSNPASGSYTINVKGTTIPGAPHEYFVVYDLIAAGTSITYPVGGEGLVPGETVTIQWDSYGDPSNTFTVEYSTDNGSNWNLINNSVAANERKLNWVVPAVPTVQAKIRVTRNATAFVSTSSVFTILGVPTLVLSTPQCPGYFPFNWSATPVTGATDYEVFLLKGSEMVSLGTTASTTYTLSGLSPDSIYWVSVRPRLNGVPGRRSVSLAHQPNTGTCAGSISDNDLLLDSITAPVYGRIATSTALTAATVVSVRIKNLDDANVTSFTMKYSVNGVLVATEPVMATIAPGATYTYNFSATSDLSSAGSYAITAEVINTTGADPVTSNNTRTDTVRQLANPLVTLPFLDDLETATARKYYKNFYGVEGITRYDYTKTYSLGRLSTFIMTGMAYSGNRSLMLDLDGWNNATGNTNFIYGTYNLNGTDANIKDIRLDFQFNMHGDSVSHPNNRVWIRGNDTSPWLEAYVLSRNENEPGVFKKSASIEINDILLAGGQNFSSSFQVRFGQFGLQRIRDIEEGRGHNFDDIRLYEAIDDIQMVSIDTPIVNSCGLGSNVPVKITIRNGSTTTLNSIPARLIVDGIVAANETIVIAPSGLAANATYQYTFTATANLSALGNHTVQVILLLATDNFHDNDTLSVNLVNSPLITSFPYLETFEAGAGNWYSGGKNNSWEYGTPASIQIKNAASGTKAWKTGLTSGYNNGEFSYLYSPCFNTTGMTNPTLSMNIALNLEDCGPTFCDGAYVEYSADGKSWSRLGAVGSGTNWYNRNYTSNHLWSEQDYANWHVVTCPLPGGISSLRLRIVMRSDPFVALEGIGVDDIHIYDNTIGIYDGVTMGSPVNQTISGGTGWIHFTSGGKLVASIQPNNQNLGSTDVQAYINTGLVRNDGRQYYHDRNITIKPATVSLADSVTVRFYFLDSETEPLLSASNCSTCTKPEDVTELGVTRYSDADDNVENGTIADNVSGTYTFLSADWNLKIPFDKGYYVEFKVRDFSEFWLNDGWIDNLTALPVQLLNFTAKKENNRDVLVEWTTVSEQNVVRFEVEVAKGYEDYRNRRFIKLGEVFSPGNSTTERHYSFLDVENNKSGARYYRLKIIEDDGTFSYSPVRPVVFGDEIPWQVYPNPSNGAFYFICQPDVGEQVNLRIYDGTGKLVKQLKAQSDGFLQKISIDLSDSRFASGMYLLQVEAEGKTRGFKVVKQ